VYYTVIKHSGHLRKLEKCGKYSPAARAFYISFVFSNVHPVLSQCNTRLRLLCLLNNTPKRTTKVKLDKIESFSWLKFIRQVRTEKGEWVYVLSDLASKSTRIADFMTFVSCNMTDRSRRPWISCGFWLGLRTLYLPGLRFGSWTL